MTTMTVEQFLQSAKPVTVSIGGQTFQALPRTFGTGSFGWYLNGKVNPAERVSIDGRDFDCPKRSFRTGSTGHNVSTKLAVRVGEETVMAQVSINLTDIGSKPDSKAKRNGLCQLGGSLTVIGSKNKA